MAVGQEKRMLRGGRLCGAVAYRVADDFLYAMNCHCSQCRRATGSAFKPLAGLLREKLSVVAGEEAIVRYGDASGHDAHCGLCGSLLYSIVDEGRRVHITLGTLHDAPSLAPTMHIFVASKAPWFAITDDLPQWPGFPGASA